MRKFSAFFGLATLLLSISQIHAAEDDPFKGTNCKKAQTQMELDYCAGIDFEAQDKKLNALYRKLLADYDVKNQTLLKTAERNWLSYRDSECEFETAGSEGGSIQPMEDSICRAEKTKARIQELQRQLDCGDDASCNPPR